MKRFCSAALGELECREESDGLVGRFEGVATVYGVPDEDGEIIQRGAFTESLRAANFSVPVLTGHDRKSVEGRAEVSEDGNRVRVSAKLDLSLPSAEVLYKRIKAGLLTDLSVGYRAGPADIQFTRNGVIIKKGVLREVSVVAFGAHPEAKIEGTRDWGVSLPAALLQLSTNLEAINGN